MSTPAAEIPNPKRSFTAETIYQLAVANQLSQHPGINLETQDALGNTALRLAIWKKDSKKHTLVIKRLLAAKASLNTTDALGKTPLHLAASQGHVNAVRALLDMNASLWAEEPEDKRTYKKFAPEIRALFDAHEKKSTPINSIEAHLNADVADADLDRKDLGITLVGPSLYMS